MPTYTSADIADTPAQAVTHAGKYTSADLAGPAPEAPAQKSMGDQLRSAGSEFAGEMGQNFNPINLVKGAAQLATHPIDTLTQGMSDYRAKAQEDLKNGDYFGAFAHAVAGSIPIAGPIAGRFVDATKAGDTDAQARAIADLISLKAVPKVYGAAAKALPDVPDAVVGAAKGLKEGGLPTYKDVMGPALLGRMIPGVGYEGGAATGIALKFIRNAVKGAREEMAAKVAAPTIDPASGFDQAELDGLAQFAGAKNFKNATAEQQKFATDFLSREAQDKAAPPPATPMTRPPQPVAQPQPQATPEPVAPANGPVRPPLLNPLPQQPSLQPQGPVRPPLATPPPEVPSYLKETTPTDKGGELPGNWAQSRINVADNAAKALKEAGVTADQLESVQKGDTGAAQKFWESVGQQPGVSKGVASGGRYVPSAATRDMIIDRLKALEKGGTTAAKVVAMDSPSIAKLRAKGLLGDAKTLADLMAGDK